MEKEYGPRELHGAMGLSAETSSEIVLVLEQMRLFRQEAMLDDDYIKEYYLDSEQIYN
jgi:hypothetical protein